MRRSGYSILMFALLTTMPAYAGQQEPLSAGVNDGTSAPATLVVPTGTVLTVQVRDRLSSDQSFPGDEFLTTLRQPLVVDGWVIARPGQTVVGRVDTVRRASRTQGTSELRLELSEIVLVDGQQLPIRTQLLASYGPSSQGENVGIVAAGTGLGAVIGGAVDGGQGAAIGAAVGAVAAIAGVLTTRGRPTEIYPETSLTFRLDAPLTVSTVRSQQAFLSVTTADYANNNPPALHRPPARIVTQQPYYYPDYYPPQIYVSPAIVYYPRIRAPRTVYVQPRIYAQPRVVVQPRIVIGGHSNGRRR